MKRTSTRIRERRGSVFPFVVVCLISLVGFVALAVDLGVMQVARTQCQNAADASAIAGTRCLTGEVANDFNKDNADDEAEAAAALNKVLGKAIDVSSQVAVQVGSYRYDEATDRFVIDPNGKDTEDAWSLVRVTVGSQTPSFFAPVLGLQLGATPVYEGGVASGQPVKVKEWKAPTPLTTAQLQKLSSLNVSARATSAHRPRDVAIIVDFSGSMRLASLLGGPITNSGGTAITDRTKALNAETALPTFGQYSAGTSLWRGTSAVSAMIASSGEAMEVSNIVETKGGSPPIVNDFFQDSTPFGTTTLAFSSAGSGYTTTPGGDNFKKKSGSSNYAKNVNEILGRTVTDSSTSKSTASPFEDNNDGSSTTAGYGSSFVGQTTGPNYWGKTFLIWPPDPRGATDNTSSGVNANNGAKDWRQRFFYKVYLGTRTSSVSAPSGSSSSSSSSSGSSSGSSTSTPPPPPPPPPLNIRGGRAFYNLTGSDGPFIAGAKSPLDNNSMMWNGGTYLGDPAIHRTSEDTSLPSYGSDPRTSGDGGYRTPGTITEFLYSKSTGNPTIRNYHRFTYQVNYDAILYWIKNTGSNPFPPRLRAGGILYYDAIPDTIDTSVHPLPTSTQAQRNQRFWKEYIDEVLGIEQYGFTTTNSIKYAVYNNRAGRMGYRNFFGWGTSTERLVWSSASGLRSMSPAPHSSWLDDTRYIDYRDNPVRASLQFWFGPMTMVDFLGNMNKSRYWLPGTTHDAPTWQCKAGVQAAIGDIRKNHPNDMISLISFSKPMGYSPSTGTTLQSGNYNTVRSPLGREYNKIINSLYFGPSALSNTEIHPWHSEMSQIPVAIGGTCYSMGFMLAYNQFARGASDATLRTYASGSPTGQAGGLGRKGAQKLVIFETDGVCTSTLYDTDMESMFTNAGAYNSYFKVRYDTAGSVNNEYPPYLAYDKTKAGNQTLEVVARLCASDTSATAPGFSTARKPVRIHCIAFGSLFDPVATPSAGTERTSALNLLGAIQYLGGTQSTNGAMTDTDKIITEDDSTARITKLKNAFSKILQDGYSVTLIE